MVDKYIIIDGTKKDELIDKLKSINGDILKIEFRKIQSLIKEIDPMTFEKIRDFQKNYPLNFNVVATLPGVAEINIDAHGSMSTGEYDLDFDGTGEYYLSRTNIDDLDIDYLFTMYVEFDDLNEFEKYLGHKINQ